MPARAVAGRSSERAPIGGERDRREITARDGIAVELNGKLLRNFCSNDYLGLAQHPHVIARLQESAAWQGIGTGLPRAARNRFREQLVLEEAVAEWQGYSRALLLESSALASLFVMQALLEKGDLCVQDRLNHAGLIDAANLVGADLQTYPHLLLDGALRQLRSRPDAPALLTTEGIFSTDGDEAPLKLLAVLARTENAMLYVDDAHGTGVLGPEGRGSVAHASLGEREVPLQLIALDSALGCSGAVLVGKTALIERIAEASWPYRCSTAMPPPLAAAASTALELARNENWRRFKLAALVARFRRGARQLGLDMVDSSTPIQSLLIGSSAASVAAVRQLERAGFFVTAILPPTATDGRARIRITLNALHEERDVDALLDALIAVSRRLTGE